MMTVAPAAAPKIAPSGAKPAVVVRATSGTVGQKKTSSPKLWNSKPPLLTTEPPKMAMPSIEPPVKEPEA